MGTRIEQYPATPVGGRRRPAGHPRPAARDAELHRALAVFAGQRSRLVTVARRVLGDADDAEDVVQETWVRWQRTDVRTVANPPGFLTTAASRLALTSLQSARARHETAATPALDGIADAASGPETTAERTEAVEVSMRVLLERLSAAERGAYVLRKGFDYPYAEVAAVLGLSAPNARQLVSRAGTRIHSTARRPVGAGAHRRLVRAFLTAARAGEFGQLEALLAADVRRPARDREAEDHPVLDGPLPRSTRS